MKTLLSICLFYLPCFLLAQGNAGNESKEHASHHAAVGHITVPGLLSLEVEQSNTAVLFSGSNDFKNGQYYPDFLKIKVISTLPWVVSAKTISATFTPVSAGASGNMPVNVMALKKSGTGNLFYLSNDSQPLIFSSNAAIVNTYFFDAAFNLGWKYKSGQYSTTVLFTLTAQ